MKKIVFSIIALFILSTSSFAQGTTDKTKLICYTVSCCGIGPIGIEIVSLKHCYYLTTSKTGKKSNEYTLAINSNKPLSNYEVKEDMILPFYTDESGNPMAIKKGIYPVENGQIKYTPFSSSKIKKVCLEEHVTGNVLGHDVDYTITLCAYYWSFSKSNANIVASLELSPKQKEEIVKNNNIVEFKKPIKVKDNNDSYTIEAGKYFVNEDGSIYLNNINLE